MRAYLKLGLCTAAWLPCIYSALGKWASGRLWTEYWGIWKAFVEYPDVNGGNCWWVSSHWLSIQLFTYMSICYLLTGCCLGAGVWRCEGEIHYGPGLACTTNPSCYWKVTSQSPIADWAASPRCTLSVSTTCGFVEYCSHEGRKLKHFS